MSLPPSVPQKRAPFVVLTAFGAAQSLGDTHALLAIVHSLADAWNRGDAHAFAAHYSGDGSFTNIVGMTLFGREAFEQQHHRIFTTIYRGSTIGFALDRIYFVRPDVAVVDATCRLAGVAGFPPGIQPDADGAIFTRVQLVLTSEQGAWWIVAFHNVAVLPMPPQS